MRDPIVQQLIDQHLRRAEEGRRRFGGTMDQNTMPPVQLIKEAIEEAMDLCVYLQAAVAKLEAERENACKPPADLERLIGVVSDYFQVTEALLRGSSRSPDVSLARHVAIHIARTKLGMTYVALGAAFKRDRTSILHACRRIEDRLLWQEERGKSDLAEDIEAISDQLEWQW